MRKHKCIKAIKEKYNYHLNELTDEEIEDVVFSIYEGLRISEMCPPIVDITNRLGMTVYHFPFIKNGREDIKGFFGVGVTFNEYENSNFFLIEKKDDEISKRLNVAELLAHYVLYIDERVVENYQYTLSQEELNSKYQRKMALALLMPKETVLAYLELIQLTYEIKIRQGEMDDDRIIEGMSHLFRVSPDMVKERLQMLKINDPSGQDKPLSPSLIIKNEEGEAILDMSQISFESYKKKDTPIL